MNEEIPVSTRLRRWLLHATDGEYRVLCWLAGATGMPVHTLFQGRASAEDVASGIATHAATRPDKLAALLAAVERHLGEPPPVDIDISGRDDG